MALHFEGKVAETTEYVLIEPGQYAVTLNAEWQKTKAGDPYINCIFKIRKDVEQDFGGRIVFDGIYKDKKTGVLKEDKINGILSTVEKPKTDFEDYDDLIQYFNGLNMYVDIAISPADPENPNSKEKNVIKYLSYAPYTEGTSAEANTNTTNEIEENDELPF